LEGYRLPLPRGWLRPVAPDVDAVVHVLETQAGVVGVGLPGMAVALNGAEPPWCSAPPPRGANTRRAAAVVVITPRAACPGLLRADQG
jgi:hypothetical protein